MSRGPQTLAPVQPRPPFWARAIPLLARLWRIIWWIWTTVIVGGLLVGIIISLAINGTSGLTDPSKWVVVQPLLAHLLPTIIGLIIAGIITLLAYLAHRHQKKAAHNQEHAEKESLVDIGRGVRKLLEDHSSNPLASPPSPSTVVHPNQEIPPGTTWNVPFRRNPLFTGREEVLKRLHNQLPTGKAAALTQPQAIIDLGGIGKTQTAVEYAYRDEYQYIFWVRADKREELVADFTTIAGLLNLPQQNAQDQNLIVEAVKRWPETHTGWLLILDNADDLQLASQFIPPAGKGYILLTTRAQAMKNLAQSIEIEKMEPDVCFSWFIHILHVVLYKKGTFHAATTQRRQTSTTATTLLSTSAVWSTTQRRQASATATTLLSTSAAIWPTIPTATHVSATSTKKEEQGLALDCPCSAGRPPARMHRYRGSGHHRCQNGHKHGCDGHSNYCSNYKHCG